MAYTFVRSVGTTVTATGTALSLVVGAGGAAVGDLVVVYFVNNSTTAATSVTDNHAGTTNQWVKAASRSGASINVEQWSCLVTTALVSGDHIDANFGASQTGSIGALEFTGGSVNMVDVSASMTPANTDTIGANTATLTPTVTGDVVVAIAVNSISATLDIVTPTNYTAGSSKPSSVPSFYGVYSIVGAPAARAWSAAQWTGVGNITILNVAYRLAAPVPQPKPETPRPFFFLPGLPSFLRPWSFLRMPPPPIPVSTAQLYTMDMAADLTFSGAISKLPKKVANAWLDFHNLIHRDWLMVDGSFSPGGLLTFGDAAGTAARVVDSLALGGMAIQITTVNVNDYGIYLADFIPVDAGVTYEFGVWTHSDAGSGFPQVLVIEFYDNTPTFITGFTQGWRWTGSTPAYANILSTAPAGATQARVYYKHSGLAFNSYTNRFIFKESSGGLRFAKATSKLHAGGLSFVGGILRQVGKDLQGGLTFVGDFSTGGIQQVLAAGLSFVGAFVKAPQKPQSGGLTFVGSHSKRTSKASSGGLSFVGSIQKVTQRAFPGGLSFSGAFNSLKVAVKTVTGGLTFAGVFSKVTNRPFTAGLTFVGGLKKLTSRAYTGGLTFVGGFFKAAQKPFTGGLTFAGAFAAAKKAAKSLTGGLSFTGAFTKVSNKVQSASLTFTGNLAKLLPAKVFTAILTFVGVFTGARSGLTLKDLTASLTFVGNTTKSGLKSLAGGLSFSAWTGPITFVAAGVIDPATPTNSATVPVPAGTKNGDFMLLVMFDQRSGSNTGPGIQAPAGWTFLWQKIAGTGAPTSQVQVYVMWRIASSEPANYAITATTGVLEGAILTYRGVNAAYPIDPDTSNQAPKSTFGAAGTTITPIGWESEYDGEVAIAAAVAFSNINSTPTGMAQRVNLSGNASSGGAVFDQTISHGPFTPPTFTQTSSTKWAEISVGLRPVTGLTAYAKAMAGALFLNTFGVSPSKSIQKALSGILSFSGAFSKIKFAGMAFTAVASFVGGLQKVTSRPLGAVVYFGGLLSRQTRRGLTAGLSFVGLLTLPPRVFFQTLTGGLSFLGVFGKKQAKGFAANVSFIGTLQSVYAYIQVQLAARPSLLNIVHQAWSLITFRVTSTPDEVLRDNQNTINERPSRVDITVKGPRDGI